MEGHCTKRRTNHQNGAARAPTRPSGRRRLCAVNSGPQSGGELRRAGFASLSIQMRSGGGSQGLPKLKRKDRRGVTQMEPPHAKPAFWPAALMRREFGAAKRRRIAQGWLCQPEHSNAVGWRQPRAAETQKERPLKRSFLLVEEDGFEPSKAKPADLQSVPFGHLGTPPYSVGERKVELVDGFEPPTC